MEPLLTAALVTFFLGMILLSYVLPGKPQKDARIIVKSGQQVSWSSGSGLFIDVTWLPPDPSWPQVPPEGMALAHTHTVFWVEITTKGIGVALHSRLAYEARLCDENGRHYPLCNAALAAAQPDSALAAALLALDGAVTGNRSQVAGALVFAPVTGNGRVQLHLPHLFEPFLDEFQDTVLPFQIAPPRLPWHPQKSQPIQEGKR